MININLILENYNALSINEKINIKSKFAVTCIKSISKEHLYFCVEFYLMIKYLESKLPKLFKKTI